MHLFVTNLLRRFSTLLIVLCVMLLASNPATGGKARTHPTRVIHQTYASVVSGYVFSDPNHNGVRDEGDSLMAYQPILVHAIKDEAGDFDVWSATDDSGHFSIEIPDTGSYIVTQENGHEGIQTYPTGNHAYTIQVEDLESTFTDLNFGNFYEFEPPVSHSRIGGTVFNDANRNGIQDEGEPGLSGIPVSIYGAQPDTTLTTDSTGRFSIVEILNGNYTLSATLPPGLWSTENNAPSQYVGVLPDSGIDSVAFPAYTISASHTQGTVFSDVNRNGVHDPGEPGLGGWSLELTGYDSYDQLTNREVTSAADGSFSFDSLWPGEYSISEVFQSRWVQTLPAGFHKRSFFLHAEQTLSALDFGNNLDSTFNTAYRSFIQESISFAFDYKGIKWGPTKGYPIGADFVVVFINTTGSDADGLTVHFNYPLADTLVCATASTQTLSPDNLSVIFAFTTPVAAGDTLVVTGRSYARGKSTESLTPGPTWNLTGSDVAASAKLTVLSKRFLQPNTADLMLAMNAPLKVGVGGPHTIYMKKFGDVGKSMYEPKAHLTQTGPAACLDGYTKTPGGTFYSFKRQASSYPLKYQSNILFGEATALQLSITASDRALTPRGFGDLIFDEGGSNPFNGKSIRFIAAKLDTFMSSYRDGPPPVPCSMPSGYETVTPGELWRVIHLIDSSFNGPMDYLTFIPKPPTMYLNGTRSIDDVPYLHIDTTLWTSGAMFGTASTPQSNLPFEFALHQNYPNPFNPSTKISFVLPSDSRVTLKVYNLLGQEVASALENEDMTAGNQEITFDASRLASGVYFYRINARTLDEDGALGKAYADLKKMVLLK